MIGSNTALRKPPVFAIPETIPDSSSLKD